MHKQSYYIINGITVYRIVAAPFLIYLIFTGRIDLFKWLLALSFFTDLIDGYLARRYKTFSALGARLDSVGDDLTIVAAIVGLFVLKLEFISEQKVIFIALFVLYAFQNIAALIKYHATTDFHTYSAKGAAILQGLFLILIFLLPQPVYILFYAAAIATGIDLIEEAILVFVLPKSEADVKGLYWVMKRKK
jgi:cardiolipin synthase